MVRFPAANDESSGWLDTLIAQRRTTTMALFLAVGIGLVAWPLASYTYPNLFPQIPFGTSHGPVHKGDVITPQLSTFIKETMALENITGLSIAVIPKHGETEFHSLGYRTEDGDEVTPDVRSLVLREMRALTLCWRFFRHYSTWRRCPRRFVQRHWASLSTTLQTATTSPRSRPI